MNFSHQILHKNLRITACGMFSIDYSLVFNVSMKIKLFETKSIKFDMCTSKKANFQVIASVTTFIVILIQFAMAIKYSPSGTFTTIIDPTERYEQTGAFST